MSLTDPSQERPPFETGLTLFDFSRIVDVANPFSNNQEVAEAQSKQLVALLGDRFDIVRVETDADKRETALLIEEAMGNEADQSIVFVRAGDGGTGGPTRAAVGRNAALWKSAAGYANNFGRASFQRRYRFDIARTIPKLRFVRTRPLFCEVTGPDNEPLYEEYIADEFGIGDMAHAQIAREEPESRDRIRQAGDIGAALLSARIGGAAILAAPPFDVVLRTKSLDGTVLNEKEKRLNELFWTNIGHIALIGRVRDSNMTAEKLVQVSNRHRTRAGAILHYAALYSFGKGGRDIPDGQSVEVELLSDTNAQGSGDPLPLAKGSHVVVRRSTRDLLVATTRKRP